MYHPHVAACPCSSIHTVRARGGNQKFRALRLDTGNFAWGSEGTWEHVPHDMDVCDHVLFVRCRVCDHAAVCMLMYACVIHTSMFTACTRKARILDVVYNASNNELVRTKTLVKGAIVQVDATAFRQW